MSKLMSEGERKDFPILCETCLGDNPYVRMIRARDDHECKICVRPFTVYKWKAGTDGRFKKTEICPNCAKIKHVCQTCLLDILTGVPIQFRDSLPHIMNPSPSPSLSLNSTQDLLLSRPKSNLMRDYQSNLKESQLTLGLSPDYTQFNHLVQITLPRNEPYYKRNRAKLCSFWVKGTCNRGQSCPFRHEIPDEPSSDLAYQNIKDRYYGTDDPVAKKMIAKIKEQTQILNVTPDITTLWVSGILSDRINESDLRDHFYPFGEIISIKIVSSHNCAFIEYSHHDEAKRAINQLRNNLVIKGQFLRVNWTKSHHDSFGTTSHTRKNNESSTYTDLQSTTNIPLPPPGYIYQGENNTLSSITSNPVHYYPSMNPHRMGASINPSPSETKS